MDWTGRQGQLGLQQPLKKIDIFGELAIICLQLVDLADTVHDRGVIAPAKPAANIGQ